MAKLSKRGWTTVGVLMLSGAGYCWIYSHADQWRSDPPRQISEHKDEQDPVAHAYQVANDPTLIAGIEKQGDKQYGGTVTWQSNRDVLGVEAPVIKGRFQLLDYKRLEDEQQEDFYPKGIMVFRMDTLGEHPVQMLGIQPMRYDATSNRVFADGLPLLAVVSQPDGTVDYKIQDLAGDLAMFRFSKSGDTPQGYQRSDAGLIALSLTSNRLLLPLHYIANLAPRDGRCSVGQATPCRKITNTFTYADSDGDAGTAAFSSVRLDSTLITERDKQTRSDRLKYDPTRHAFLRFDGHGIDPIEALSPVKADVFLATRPVTKKTE